MANYFNFFPKTYYYSDNNSDKTSIALNLLTRFGFEKVIKDNIEAFYEYDIQDSDTPEIIAYKYYKSVERHWIVLLFNDILDPQFDWPMDSKTLLDYVDKKYVSQGGANWARNIANVQAYYKISTRTSDYDGTQLIEKFQITESEYANTGISSMSYRLEDGSTVTEKITTETSTYFDYENDLNEKKRKIRLIKPEFVPEIEKEFRKVIQ